MKSRSNPSIETDEQMKESVIVIQWNTAAAAAKSLQSCPTLCDPRWQPTRLPRPWDSPGKNTGVGCHFLLQCMKVKSESEVAQSCPTLSDPMDCGPPGSSVHGIFQARVLEWGNGILFCSKKEWGTDTCYNRDKLWKHYTKWKKPVYIWYDSLYIKGPNL